MTPSQFRHLALSFSGATESSHMNHPDFRVNGRVFATLGYPDEAWGMAKVTPEKQKELLRQAPKIFEPSKGAWGLAGSTLIRLNPAKPAEVREALQAAWTHSRRKGGTA